MSVSRRLAAILAADVVGFGRLMEQDEVGTLAALKSRRKDVLDPLVAKHQGRVFKVTGDGVLVEFGSAVNAVQCAVDLQQAFADANKDLSDDRRIVLRIGVNLGDVMVEGGDLYGDGVNIAARLEALAEPGGILVAGTAHDHLGTKVKVGFEDMGALNLKNISQPVRAYRAGTAEAVASEPPALPDKPSVAVLPFENLSGDPEQEYFSDGITEDIITELARFHSLFVIARNSSFQYRGKAVDVRRVGRELGVRYVVEGSVRRSENRVRITAQLLEADSGAHLWADRYDRALDDIFAVQEEVTRAIVAALPRLIGEAQVEHRRRRPTRHLSAYDLVLRGEWQMSHGGVTGNQEALSLFEQALAIDPACARAHAYIAYQHTYAVFQFSSGSEERLRRARHHAEQALALDDGDATVHENAAFVHLVAGEHRLAESHAIKAVMLNPNDRYAVGARGLVAMFRGDARLGIEWHLKARRLDPRNFNAGREPLIEAYYCARDYAAALDEFQQWRRPPPHVLLLVVACHAQLGQSDQARAIFARFEATRPQGFDFSEYVASQYRMYEQQADRDHWRDGYRKAGLPV
jgi:TolB-like protein/Tfp pilus assembly protein PilF